MQFHKVNNSQYELTMKCKLWQFNLPHFTKNTRHNFFANKIPTTIYNLQVALLNYKRFCKCSAKLRFNRLYLDELGEKAFYKNAAAGGS